MRVLAARDAKVANEAHLRRSTSGKSVAIDDRFVNADAVTVEAALSSYSRYIILDQQEWCRQ